MCVCVTEIIRMLAFCCCAARIES